MATLKYSVSLDEIARPDFGTAERQLYRATVHSVADRARAAMDSALHGRIDKAQALVLAGDIALLPDGTAHVASQSNGTTQYVVCNGTCECKDVARAPHQWCKHRLAAAIATRTQQALTLADERLASAQASPEPTTPVAPVPALPEAPASVNVRLMLHGREVQITLRDSDEHRLLARLTALLQEYPAPEAPKTTAAPGAGWCTKHGVQMTLNQKEGQSWYSHKVGDTWCKGK